jgi:hypothetical protein
MDFRWPKIGDKLFPQRQSAYGAYLEHHPPGRLYHMTQGYKLAADLLVEQAEAEAWRKQKLVYPTVFCYRHFLELTLKAMLENYGSMGNVTANWSHHRLEDLWRDFRVLLRNADADNSKEDGTEVVEQCIAEFVKIDPLSETFRYPSSRKGQPFEIACEIIDLVQLRDTMQAIENYFMAGDVVCWVVFKMRNSEKMPRPI